MIPSLSSVLLLMTFVTSVQNVNPTSNRTKELLILWKDKSKPRNLNVHKNTNALFFCMETSDNLDYQLAYHNIDTKESQTIRGIRKGCAIAIDQANGVVYLGGLGGIYKYNMDTGKPDFFAERGIYVWSLFFSNRLYYIRYPDRKVFMEFEGQFGLVDEFKELQVDQFYVTKEGAVVFGVQNSAFIFHKNETKSTVKVLREINAINAISEDSNGNVYLGTNRGVYTVLQHGLQRILPNADILGLTFDKNNNMVLADDKSIYRLL